MFNKIISIISPSITSLEYIEKRLYDDNYRGFAPSQHNRYDQKKLKIILEEIHKKVGYNLMQIRTTDISKRPKNIEGEEEYADFCLNVKRRTNNGIPKQEKVLLL